MEVTEKYNRRFSCLETRHHGVKAMHAWYMEFMGIKVPYQGPPALPGVNKTSVGRRLFFNSPALWDAPTESYIQYSDLEGAHRDHWVHTALILMLSCLFGTIPSGLIVFLCPSKLKLFVCENTREPKHAVLKKQASWYQASRAGMVQRYTFYFSFITGFSTEVCLFVLIRTKIRALSCRCL